MSLAFSGASLLYGVISKMVTSVYVAADSKTCKICKGTGGASSSGSADTSSSSRSTQDMALEMT